MIRRRDGWAGCRNAEPTTARPHRPGEKTGSGEAGLARDEEAFGALAEVFSKNSCKDNRCTYVLERDNGIAVFRRDELCRMLRALRTA